LGKCRAVVGVGGVVVVVVVVEVDGT